MEIREGVMNWCWGRGSIGCIGGMDGMGSEWKDGMEWAFVYQLVL